MASSVICNSLYVTSGMRVNQNAFIDIDISTQNVDVIDFTINKNLSSNIFTDGTMSITNNEITNLNGFSASERNISLKTTIDVIDQNNQVLFVIEPPKKITVIPSLNLRATASSKQKNTNIYQPLINATQTVRKTSTMCIKNAPKSSTPGTFLTNPKSLKVASGGFKSNYTQSSTSRKSGSMCITGGMGVNGNIHVGRTSVDMYYNGVLLTSFKEDPTAIISGNIFIYGNTITFEGNTMINGDTVYNAIIPTHPLAIAYSPTLVATSPVTTNNASTVSITAFNGDAKFETNTLIKSNTIVSNDNPYAYILSSFIDNSTYSVNNVNWNAIGYNPRTENFILLSENSPYGVYLDSSTKEWKATNLSVGARACAFHPQWEYMVAVGTNMCYYSSAIGTWVDTGLGMTGVFNGITSCFEKDCCIIVGENIVGSLTNSVGTWTLIDTSVAIWKSVAWSSKLNLCAICGVGKFGYTSTTVFGGTSTVAGTWNSICWSSKLSKFLAVGTNSMRAVSIDGVNWTSASMGITSSQWNSVIYNENYQIFVAVGNSGVAYSIDGNSWNLTYSGTNLNSILFAQDVFRISKNPNSLVSTDVYYQSNVTIGTTALSNVAINAQELTFNGYDIFSGLDAYTVSTTSNYRIITPIVSRYKVGNISYVFATFKNPEKISPSTTTFPTMDLILTLKIGLPQELNIGDDVPFTISQPSTARFYCNIVYTATLEFTMSFVNDVVAPESYNVMFWFVDYS